jgi:hypothetical protein
MANANHWPKVESKPDDYTFLTMHCQGFFPRIFKKLAVQEQRRDLPSAGPAGRVRDS